MNNSLKNKKLFLLDMDGTIYLEDDLFDGTLDFLAHVKSIGGRYLFLTNNSSKGIDKYTEKLARLGIESTPDDFLTSTEATIAYLNAKNHNKIYAFGTTSFKKQLADAGLPITDKLEDGIDCLCIANDWELTFKKLEDSCILLKNSIITKKIFWHKLAKILPWYIKNFKFHTLVQQLKPFGFSDYNNFGRKFKEYYGYPPSKVILRK